MAVGIALCLCTGMLASCTQNDEPQEESSVSSAVTEKEDEFSSEEAMELVKERLPLDFEKIYTLSVNSEDLEWNGRHYYHFLISDEMVTMETSVLVDQENQQIFTYYPDGSAYAPEDDPFCKAAEESSQSTENSQTESGGSETSNVESPMEWKGTYQNEAGIILSIEPQDTTSFEFTLLDSSGAGVEHQVARSDGNGTAVSYSSAEYTVTFTQQQGKIIIETDGNMPDGFDPDGEYSPIEE